MSQTNAIKAALVDMARAAARRAIPWVAIAMAALVAAGFALAAVWAMLEEFLEPAGASAVLAVVLAVGAGAGALLLRRRRHREALRAPPPQPTLTPSLMAEVFLAAMRTGRSARR